MRRAPPRLVWLVATLAAVACVERIDAPGQCPAFCPSGSIQIVDTMLLTNVSRDSSYRGYVLAHQAPAMVVSSVPGVIESRAIILTTPLGVTMRLLGDTVRDTIVASDSVKVRFVIARRDSLAHDVTLAFYRLPVTIDSTTTYADLAGSFAAPPLRTVNLDSLLAKPNGIDSTTGDSIARDTTTHRLTLSVRFDSLQVPYPVADSGKLGIGVRVTAAEPTTVALATRRTTSGSTGITWFLQVDSTTDTSRTRVHEKLSAVVQLDTYVFDPPPAPLDSTLAVGSVPSARSLLRINLPRSIRDSTQVIRATLLLVPAVAARGAPGDSFVVEAHTILADFGAKSPFAVDVTRTDTTMIRIGVTDTVRIEVTNLLQFWATDTLVPTALMLRAQDEAASPAEIRFYPSVAAAYAPALQLTFSRKFPFGAP